MEIKHLDQKGLEKIFKEVSKKDKTLENDITLVLNGMAQAIEEKADKSDVVYPDWNVNEYRPGFIENRPFYSEPMMIGLGVSQWPMVKNQRKEENNENIWYGSNSFEYPISITVGKTYKVEVKKVDKQDTPYEEAQMLFSFDLYAREGEFISDGDSKEPWEDNSGGDSLVIFNGTDGLEFYWRNESYPDLEYFYLTIEEYGENVKEIDLKYIPFLEREEGEVVRIKSNGFLEGIHAGGVGERAHAEGNATFANGEDSHAEGGGTTADGSRAHAEGSFTNAQGDSSHAEGLYTTATGDNSHAEGEYTTALGNNSHAEGYQTLAKGQYSHTEGYQTEVNNDCEHTCGQYNMSYGEGEWGNDVENQSVFNVGNGTDNGRHNAIDIRQNGDIYIPDTNDEEGEYYEKKMLKLQDCIFRSEIVLQEQYDNMKEQGTLDKNTFYMIVEEE